MAISINTKDFFETIKPFDRYEEVTIYVDNNTFVEASREDDDGHAVIRNMCGEEISKEDLFEMVKDYKVVYFEAKQILKFFDGIGIHFDIYLRSFYIQS